MQRNNSNFVKIAPSGKAKFKHKKCKKIKWLKRKKISLQIYYLTVLTGLHFLRLLNGNSFSIKHCLRQTKWSRDVYFCLPNVDFRQRLTLFKMFSPVLVCIKSDLPTQFEFNSETFEIFEKVACLVIFIFTVHIFSRLFWRHQCRQRPV